MTNFSTASDNGAGPRPAKGAVYQFPGHARQADNEPQSLSEDFNHELDRWFGRIQASGGARIGKSRFAAHDRAIESSSSSHRIRKSRPSGKVPGISWKEAGFFDLGISLLVLALSGSAVYVIEKDHAESVASAPENVEILAERHPQHFVDRVANVDSDGSDLAL
jgi:hypothetical protein